MPPELQPTTLKEWLALLEQRHPVAIDMGLERVSAVLQRMALDFSNTRIITIGGTNGKGSTATLCAALLQAHGAQVGLYTSPHLLDFRERIVVNGVWVSTDTLLQAFARVEQARADISLTYFEFTTLAALQVFADAQVDWCVLEVGLGGRLDAVNALTPDVSVITSIGMDHMDWLGDTLEKIAIEKAGIGRSGKPFIVAPTPVDRVLEAAAEQLGAHLIQPRWPSLLPNGQWSPSAPHPLANTPLPMPQLPLNSAHLALHTLTQVQVVLEPALVAQTLNETQMLGRLQRVSWQGLPIWLDVAHNAAAARWVVERLQPLSPQWSIILGMRQDKDVAAVVDSLSVLDPHWIVLDLSDSVQGLSSTELIQRTELKTARVAASVPEALAIAQRLGHPTLICGSFLTIAAALRTLQPQDDHE